MNLNRAINILKKNNMALVESATNNVVVTCKKRIQDHIKRVKYFYNVLVENGQIPLEDIDIKRIMSHDKDKLKYNNLKRQALRYCGDRKLTDLEKQQIDDVVMEHIKSNPHHCEYWGDGDYASLGIDCTSMEDTYIYELCADWAATAEEKGSSLLEWCNKVINTKFMFTDEQVDLINSLCNYLNEYIDPSLKRDYGLKSIKLSQMWM